MLDQLAPDKVIVHGFMPDDVFGDYLDQADFIRFPSEFETTHKEESGGNDYGSGI